MSHGSTPADHEPSKGERHSPRKETSPSPSPSANAEQVASVASIDQRERAYYKILLVVAGIIIFSSPSTHPWPWFDTFLGSAVIVSGHINSWAWSRRRRMEAAVEQPIR